MITRTTNMDMVNSILSHPVIWKDIAPDVAVFEAPYDRNFLYFLMGEADGVIIFHPFRDGLKIHPNILPNKRGKKAYKAVEDACQEVFAMGCTSIYAEIAPELRHVISFARALGFKWFESGDRELFVRRKMDS